MSCLSVWSQLTDVCVSGVINEDRLRELLTTMGDRFKDSEVFFCCCCCVRFIHTRTPVSAAVAVDSSHMIVPSSALWSRFSPPSNFVNGYVLTMRFMVCLWPQSQEGDWARRHLCKLAWHGPWPVWKQFIRDHVWRRRSKPGCRIVGSLTAVWLTAEADDQSSLHCVIVSTDVMSDHIGRRDASLGGGCLKTCIYWELCSGHTHLFNGPLSSTTQVSRYQKSKTNLDFTEARDSEWRWYQLGHMQVCTSLQTDYHTSTPPLGFFARQMPFLPANQRRQSTEGNVTRINVS